MTKHGLWRWAEAETNRRALVETNGRETSAGELAAAANQVLHSLRQLGLGVGDGVAALLPNGKEFLSIYLAAIQGGVHFPPINFHESYQSRVYCQFSFP